MESENLKTEGHWAPYSIFSMNLFPDWQNHRWKLKEHEENDFWNKILQSEVNSGHLIQTLQK